MPEVPEGLLAGKPPKTHVGAVAAGTWVETGALDPLKGPEQLTHSSWVNTNPKILNQQQEGNMKGIGGKILELLKKLGYFIMEYVHIVLAWFVRSFKVQLQSMKKAGSRKELEKTYSGLGAEIYALYKQRAIGWESMPSVQQLLRVSEDAEAEIFKVDGAIEEINSNYLRKKNEIKEKYALKRAEAGKAYSEKEESQL